MVGFYLAINKITNNGGIKLLTPPYESLADLDTLGKQGLYIFKDEHRQIVQGNGYTIFNIGTLIYKNAWQNKALQLIKRDLSSGNTLREIMSNTRGQFCLVVHTVTDVFVIVDGLGSFPVYIFEDNSTIQISNILLLLAKNNDVSINHQAFADYLSFDYCVGSTFFNEIERLKMATIYQFGSNQKIQVYDEPFSDIHFNKYTNLHELAGIVKETLCHNLSFLSSTDKIFVDITGGFDTRTVATLLQSMNIDFEAGTCGEQVLGESELAERVGQALGVKFHSDINITDMDSFEQILDRHFLVGTGVPIFCNSTELINYYAHIRQDFDIHITGFGGTELTTQDLPKLSLFSSRINKKSLFQKLFNYNDIFFNSFLTKAEYYDNLARKIDSVLYKVGTDLHNEVANFLHFYVYNRNYHGCLIATHNVIMPLYSPFLERVYVKLMVEASYSLKNLHQIQRTILTELNPIVSSIITSHGYSADIRSGKVNSAFRRSKNGVKKLARQMIYQFGLFGLMRWVQNTTTKIKPAINLEEVQRRFWISKVNNTWSDDMAIFELIDRNKLNKRLVNGRDVSKLKAKILYLNRIIHECSPSL